MAATSYFGVTPPIAMSGPSADEEAANDTLMYELRAQYVFESEEEFQKREQILGMIQDLVHRFVRRVTLSMEMSEQEAEAAGGKIFTFGSYRLGVHGPGSDIDILCVVPKHVTHNEFFTTFASMLEELDGVAEVADVPKAFAPTITAKIHGVPIDLLLASLNRRDIPEDLKLDDNKVLAHTDKQTVRSLGGPRATEDIFRLVPNTQVFRDSLRCIRRWAQQRAIYSDVNGYLGGVAWAILVARICQLYPNLNAAAIIHRFFIIMTQWKWPQPMLLRRIEKEMEDVRTSVRVWDPRLYPTDRLHLMPIITPAYPAMCSTHNVTSSTLSIMKDEFIRGARLVEKIMLRRARWSELFDKRMPAPVAPQGGAVISRSMNATEIIQLLLQSGCSDVTRSLNLYQCGKRPIAGGGFGDIYQGVMLNGAKIAIKCPRLFLKTDEQGNSILKATREIYTWSKLKHPNVLELVGLATFRDQISIVSLWMENGTLPEYIAKNPTTDRLKLCLEISTGLAYLHKSGVVHGDVKGANVLISTTGAPKLTDFGNAVLRKYTLEFTGGTATLQVSMRWTAPELLMRGDCYTKEADIFGLGMVFFEVVSGEIPFHGKPEHIACALIIGRKTPEMPKDMESLDRRAGQLQHVMSQCWSFDAVGRPSASDVEYKLRDINGPTLPNKVA